MSRCTLTARRQRCFARPGSSVRSPFGAKNATSTMSSSTSTREPIVHSTLTTLYVGWLRARLRSTIFWTVGVAAVLVVNAAFYPSLKDFFADFQPQGNPGVSSLLGLTNGIDPSSPLGYLWSNLYSNVLPWMLMALGVALGASAIAGDEEVG